MIIVLPIVKITGLDLFFSQRRTVGRVCPLRNPRVGRAIQRVGIFPSKIARCAAFPGVLENPRRNSREFSHSCRRDLTLTFSKIDRQIALNVMFLHVLTSRILPFMSRTSHSHSLAWLTMTKFHDGVSFDR